MSEAHSSVGDKITEDICDLINKTDYQYGVPSWMEVNAIIEKHLNSDLLKLNEDKTDEKKV